MKILTALAAALAAGLTTFAANALEEGSQQVSMVPAGTSGAWTRDMRLEKNEEAGKSAQLKRGLTSEEVFHTVKVARTGIKEPRQKDDAVTVAAATKEPRQKDDAVVAAAVPREPYKIIIERYASLNGVPLSLAHAVITVESNYRPYSRGKAGEVGLMQIKPTTAKLMGYSGSTTGLFDPETNIKYGMKYLGKAQRLGGGTTCGTILKYNAGHAAKRMNPISQDYCDKVKRHIVNSIGWLWSDREYDRREDDRGV